MGIILWIIVVLQWVTSIYIPIVCFVGIVSGIIMQDITDVICNPFLFVKRVSIQKGWIIWVVYYTIFGVILYDFARWYRLGINPFLQM